LTTRFIWTECLKKLMPNEVTSHLLIIYEGSGSFSKQPLHG
jgi:hypothetical protein